jgi:hypothetical protein
MKIKKQTPKVVNQPKATKRQLWRVHQDAQAVGINFNWTTVDVSKEDANRLIKTLIGGDDSFAKEVMKRPARASLGNKVSAYALAEAVIKFLGDLDFDDDEIKKEAEEVLAKARTLHAFVKSNK